MFARAKTADGHTILFNADKVSIVGPVVADGKTLIGQAKLMFENGLNLLVGQGVLEIEEAITNAEVTGVSAGRSSLSV